MFDSPLSTFLQDSITLLRVLEDHRLKSRLRKSNVCVQSRSVRLILAFFRTLRALYSLLERIGNARSSAISVEGEARVNVSPTRLRLGAERKTTYSSYVHHSRRR